MDKESLGERVRTLREDLALSQKELAELSGVTENTIGRIERGVVYPRMRTLRHIAEALDVDPKYLRRGGEE